MRQARFADGLVNQRAGRNAWLGDIETLIDWSALYQLLAPIDDSDERRLA